MPRPVNAVDFWRGFALVTIFINHIPGIFYEKLTHRNYSLSDSAELFVFLAGWSLRHVVGRPDDPTPTHNLVFRLGGRAITIYAAHMTIVMLAIAMLGAAAIILENPLILEWHNAAAVFNNPVETHIGLVLLSHQLGYFDILPLYVVLMLFAPLVAIIHRQAPNLLVPISLAIYFCALVFKITVPTWPTEGQWFFNPLCWQLVFVLGFSLSREHGPGGWVRAHIRWVRIAAVPLLVAGSVMVWMRWTPDPTQVPEPKLLFIVGKTFVTPIRLIHFLALVAVFSAVYPLIEKAVPRLVEFLSMLGRNSLQVFCTGSVLSLAGQIVRFYFRGGMIVDTVLVVVGICLLGAVAWLSEWRGRARRPA
ncbi:MAG TPA: OpgC domain-containing protein [Hyphomicrobiaceae bacterium]|nr:OpgC domain-containing protein [Hyphomicrobiaceae bacterium]